MKSEKSKLSPGDKTVSPAAGTGFRRWLRNGICLSLIPVLLSGCTTTTGDQIALSRAEVAKIRNLGVVVRTEHGFSVYYSRDEMTASGAVIGGLLGAAIESGARASADADRTERLKPGLGDFDPQRLVAEQVTQKLQAANLFQKVEIIDSKDVNATSKLFKGTDLDGLLIITIHRWGLASCPESRVGEQIQVSFDSNVKMMLLNQSAPAWDRNDFYLDGECHSVNELVLQSGLLRTEFNRAVDELTGKLVNAIRFPQ
jgi:hypothetical protein